MENAQGTMRVKTNIAHAVITEKRMNVTAIYMLK